MNPFLFHKPNKKMKSEKKMNHFISQTKHTINVVFYIWDNFRLSKCTTLYIIYTIKHINEGRRE
jgi:hypothetical protein